MTSKVPGARSLSRIFIDTSRAQQAFVRLNALMERGWEENYCLALLLLGPSGCGKTTILKEWRRRRQDADATFRGVVSEVPPRCNLPDMISQLLQDLGDPDPGYGEPNERLRRIEELGRGADFIALDEMQRLVDPNTGTVKRDVASWITNLLNRRICPFVLAGENSASTVFEAVEYAESRMFGQVDVLPYDWNTERREFRVFLSQLEKGLGMEASSDLSSPETSLRLHSFSDGRLRQVARVVSEARAIALGDGRPSMTHDDLARAVDLLRIGSAKALPNPFRLADPKPGGKPPSHVRDVIVPQVRGRGRKAKAG